MTKRLATSMCVIGVLLLIASIVFEIYYEFPINSKFAVIGLSVRFVGSALLCLGGCTPPYIPC